MFKWPHPSVRIPNPWDPLSLQCIECQGISLGLNCDGGLELITPPSWLCQMAKQVWKPIIPSPSEYPSLVRETFLRQGYKLWPSLFKFCALHRFEHHYHPGLKLVKIKANPEQAQMESEDARRLRLPESLNNRHMKVARLLALRPGRLYPPPPGEVLVLTSVKSLKHLIGNQTCDILACSTMLEQPLSLSSARIFYMNFNG
jgi:hypothetical protein